MRTDRLFGFKYKRRHYLNYVHSVLDNDLKDVLIDLNLNDDCSLKCKYCYYGETKSKNEELNLEQWRYVLADLIKFGARMFNLSGKEITCSSQFVELINLFSNAYHTNGIEFGMITNGTGKIEQYVHVLNANAKYLEFSLDGGKDNYRSSTMGIGYFDVIKEKISSLVNMSFGDRLSICTTFYRTNLSSYFDFIDELYKVGIRRFFGAPIKLVGNAKNMVNEYITPSVLVEHLERTMKFLAANDNQNKEIHIMYCIPKEYIEYISTSFLKNDVVRFVYERKPIVIPINGNYFQIMLPIYNIAFLQNLTITSDGFAISNSSVISDSDYLDASLGSIINDGTNTILKRRRDLVLKNLNI